jgi:predicted AAA+ superfamily ATPase
MVSASSTKYRPRLIDPLLDELLAQLPAMLVPGPRTAGKTTTLARRAATVVRLDRQTGAAAFEADPDVALRGLPEPVLLDEWQRVPGVLGAVRRAVEADPHPNRFYVTGSVRAELEHEVWPGTGRLVRLTMYPMTVAEQLGHSGPPLLDKLANGQELTVPKDPPDLRGYIELALRSGFPDAALRLTGRAREMWLESYIEDLLSHDVEQLEETPGRRRDTQRLRRYLEAYALNSAGVAEHKTIYDAAQVNKATGGAYDDLLASLLITENVPAWASNRLKRLVHQPKRYLIDAALIATALRLDEQGVMNDGDLLGRILDTFVAAQLRPELATSRTRPRLHHLRTEQGRHEIDLIAELAGQRVVGIEVKASAAPTRDDAKHLRWLHDELGERFLAGIVLHTGPRAYELDEKITAAPIAVLWG